MTETPREPNTGHGTEIANRYDVIVAGARCAGAATAMLLARRGLRVLVVDPQRPGSDTLSTHALMRDAVSQLTRWNLLRPLVAAGTPPVRRTTFVYGGEAGSEERVDIDIAPRDGIDALYAPRRTVLDPVLQEGARAHGADVRLGWAVTGVVRRSGVVVGAEISSADGRHASVGADLVIGADGIHSRVARLVGARTTLRAEHAAATIYAYLPDPGLGGYLWAYRPGVSVGAIPTNGNRACVFTSMPPARFEAERARGLAALHGRILAECVPGLAHRMDRTPGEPTTPRAFAGVPGFVREGHGPGWALVGDAGYFRDPITAHGITDALRESELLADAILSTEAGALARWSEGRSERVRGFLEVTDRIASLAWSMDEIRELHLALSREMRLLAKSYMRSAVHVTSTAPSRDFAVGHFDT
jgi:menaquinone-9 beta-reductase